MVLSINRRLNVFIKFLKHYYSMIQNVKEFIEVFSFIELKNDKSFSVGTFPVKSSLAIGHPQNPL